MADRSRLTHLPKIKSPADLHQFNQAELTEVAAELRRYIIEVVASTGGHLGSNLGAIELTLALHYCYDAPRDQIVWDVGAQAYAHKILTGRFEQFRTNRQYGGISGFPRRAESPYDAFGVGHSSTSISAALGIAVARDLLQQKHKVIAVIGDGGMTGGMAFEGLNHAGGEGRDITVILNDNRMAISPSVGALSAHLSSLRADTRFERLKDSMWEMAGKLPKGSKLRKALHGVDSGIRAMLVPGLWFERLGFRYIGPVDGHNLPELIKMFSWLREVKGPVLVHILTQKGKGYEHAENDALNLHGVSKFDVATGPEKSNGGGMTFAAEFSDELLQLAKRDPRIVAITPAMIEGSCLNEFQKALPDRCFDVGIAEQHAVTYAAGLAANGLKPVLAIYSSFLQRGFDQLIHDVALQDIPVIFGVDRAGLVGEDGPTHHGSFDLSFMRSIPNLNILIPRDGGQMRSMLDWAVEAPSPTAIRFPRGKPPRRIIPPTSIPDITKPELLIDGNDGLIIGCGPILSDVVAVLERLRVDGIELALLDLRCLKPLDDKALEQYARKFEKWLTIEENVLQGGMGSTILEWLSDHQKKTMVKRLGLPDRFVTHGDRAALLTEVGLDSENIFDTCRKFFYRKPKPRLDQLVLGRVEA